MVEQDKKQQIQRQVLLLVMLVAGCLGAGGFAVARGISVYQINELLAKADAEEKFSQLPQQYDLAWLKDSDSSIRDRVTYALVQLKATATTRRSLDRELIFLGGSLATLVLLLRIPRYFKQVKGITFSYHLNCYFPEEIVAELAALREGLTDEKKSTWLIRFILFYQVLTLVWGIYIQINIDNLTLPSCDRRIDK